MTKYQLEDMKSQESLVDAYGRGIMINWSIHQAGVGGCKCRARHLQVRARHSQVLFVEDDCDEIQETIQE